MLHVISRCHWSGGGHHIRALMNKLVKGYNANGMYIIIIKSKTMVYRWDDMHEGNEEFSNQVQVLQISDYAFFWMVSAMLLVRMEERIMEIELKGKRNWNTSLLRNVGSTSIYGIRLRVRVAPRYRYLLSYTWHIRRIRQ